MRWCTLRWCAPRCAPHLWLCRCAFCVLCRAALVALRLCAIRSCALPLCALPVCVARVCAAHVRTADACPALKSALAVLVCALRLLVRCACACCTSLRCLSFRLHMRVALVCVCCAMAFETLFAALWRPVCWCIARCGKLPVRVVVAGVLVHCSLWQATGARRGGWCVGALLVVASYRCALLRPVC